MKKLKAVVCALIVASLGLHGPVMSAEDKLTASVKTSLQGFVKLLRKDYQPTLADYQQYFGYSDIEELQFQWAQCQEKGQTPYLRHKDCFQTVIKAWNKKSETPSAYLAWIRRLLPSNPKAKVLKIEQASLRKGYGGSNVTVDMQGVRLTFWRPGKSYQAASGEFSLVSIKDVPLAHYRKTLGNVSVLTALGLTDLIRPLTKQEVASRRAAWDKECAIDPVCAKSKAEDEANKKLEKLAETTRRSVGQSFDTWCEKNSELCQTHRLSIANLDREIYAYRDKCADDYKVCVLKLLELHQQKQDAQQAFCKDNEGACEKMKLVNKETHARDVAWCKANSERCKKMNSPFDNAMLEVSGMLYSQKNRGS